MTKQFKTSTEAHQIMGALHAAGKAPTWQPVVCFGRVTVNVWSGVVWQKLTNAMFAQMQAV